MAGSARFLRATANAIAIPTTAAAISAYSTTWAPRSPPPRRARSRRVKMLVWTAVANRSMIFPLPGLDLPTLGARPPDSTDVGGEHQHRARGMGLGGHRHPPPEELQHRRGDQ